MVGRGMRSKRFHFLGSQGLLDDCIAMVPKADGDSTPLGQRPISVLPVVSRLWASVKLGHLREWVEGWLPESVFSLGRWSLFC